ncbi:AAA_11 domain-containing protein [Trichonephila clavipes]|nr:AAA_11 domain-containing protein [Trichonephila clavipes]
MNENTNYENLSIKKEIEDLSETIVPTSVPLPTSVFNVEFNNSKELDSEINSNLVLNVNNPTNSQIETPLHALANPANSKPAPKKRKCTRRRHVYSKPKKKNKKKKEVEKMPFLSEQNLQHLIEKKSNDNCSDSSDTIILDEELSSHISDFANKLPNILCKEEELEPELGKLLISPGMLLEDADESFKTSSKISSKDQSKISNGPLIKQEPEEFSEPPVLYPVMKEAVCPYFDHERLKMTTFPLLSGSVKESTQPSKKKKQTQAARRGNKKQAACEKTISEPNKTLRESLSFDNFSTTNEKDVFSGESFENINDTVSKSNLFAEKSKRKRPAPKRGASKKTVQISSSLNNESISGNKVTAFPSLSPSKKKKPQTARRGGKKQAACERTVSEPNKILNENLTLDGFPPSNEKDFFHGQSAEKSKGKKPAVKRGASKKMVIISTPLNNESVFEQWNNVNYFNNDSFSESNVAQKPTKKKYTPNKKTTKDTLEPKNSFECEEDSDSFGLPLVKKPKKCAPRKRASRTSARNKKGESAILGKKDDDVVISVKKELCDPSHSKDSSLKHFKSDTVECSMNVSNSAPIDTIAFVNMCFEADRLSQPLFSNENTFEIESDKVSEISKESSKSSLCRPGKNLENNVDSILSNSVLQAKTVTKILPEQDVQNSELGFQSGILNLSNLNTLKIKKEKENSPDKITSVETNFSNNMHPQLVDKDICNDSTVMMPNISGSCTNTCVQKYSSISNAHSLINSQNSIIDSEKILDYSNIAIKKEPEDLTECVKTSADKNVLNLNCNTVSQNQKIISRSHDQEMPQVEHSLQFCANTEKSHNSALSVGIPNVVSNSQPTDNSVHSSQSKHFEPNNVFVHKIKEEPKEAEPNSTIIENSRSAVKSHNQNELDHMKTFLINETGRESTLKEALPLHSSHDNGRIASPSLNLNTLLLNESRQTNTCNQEMHLLKASSNCNTNINKNFDSTPFPNINNPVHASDDSGYAQPKTFKTSSITQFRTSLNVAIKTEPAETVEKSVCTENEHSVRSLQSLVQLECENTASKTNSTICSSDNSDNDGKHKNLGNSNSYLNSEVSNLKLTSSTSGVHESIFREHFQSNSTPQEMLQIAVPSVKSVANRNESCHSVILPSVPSTYLDRHASDNASQIQLEIGKSSSVKVRIKEEHVEDEADEIVINIRSKPSSVHVQEFNELGKQNTCISEDSSARNSLHLFPKESTEEVSSDEVDISFNTSKSLGNPDAFSECISESTICRRMDKNSSLGNVNSTSGFVNQSLINEKTLKTVKNSSLITSSIVTSLQENVSDKLGIDQPSIDTAEKSVNGSPFCAKTGLSVHPADKVSSSDIISQTQRKMLQTMETSNLITSSTTAAHQESTICANTDLDICLIDLDCSSPVKQTVPNEKNNNLISSSTFNVKTETFCENASSLLSKEPDNVLEYNQGLLNSNSSSQSSESNFCDNLILNSVKASSNIISESSSNDGIMNSTENLVEFSEISDESNSSEKLIDVPHSFIDEDQNSLDQNLYEMSDVSDSSGSDDEVVEGFLDCVFLSFASRFKDRLKLSDEDGNKVSVEYAEKCIECIHKDVLDIALSYKKEKEDNSGESVESEKIISKPIILDGDSSEVIDSTSFNVNENGENTCTQTLTVERMNSRPITTSNIDSITVALNEITPEGNTSNPTVIFEKITSRSITSNDTNLCSMTDSVSTAMNKITSEKEREESTCSEDVIFEGISTPVSSCDTDPNNVIELKSVINKSISEKENTNNQTATFNGIPSRPVIPLHKDPCNATDSEENTCRQTGVFEGTTPGQVTSNNSVSIVSEEETTATSERTISEPIASNDNLHNVTDSIPPELEVMDDSMDSVQTDTSSVSRFSLNQNDGKFDILFNFRKNLKRFFKHPYPGDSFKLIQQTNSVSKYYSRFHSIFQNISLRNVVEKLKNAAEAESNLNFNVGDALTIERYPLTKEEIVCFFKLVVMSPSISLMSKCNLAVGECPSAIPEISSNDGFDVTYCPSSLNLVSKPLKLVSNPLNLLSTQIFKDNQVMEGTSFESGANEINNMPDHGSSMQNIEENTKKLIEDNTQKIVEDNTQMIIKDSSQMIIEDNTQVIIEDNTQVIIEDNTQVIIEDDTQMIIQDDTQKVIEDDTQKVIEDNTQKVIEDDTQKVIEDDTQKVIEDDTQKVIEDDTQKVIEDDTQKVIEDDTQKVIEDDTQKVIEDDTQKVIEDNNQKEMSHNVSFDYSSNLRLLLENLKANILHLSETRISEKGVEDFTYQDCHEVFDECAPSWREMNKNSQLTKSASTLITDISFNIEKEISLIHAKDKKLNVNNQNIPSSELQNVSIDISHRSKETLNDISQNVHTLANLNKSSHNILIEPLENSANSYFENELKNSSSLKSIEFHHQLPTFDPVATQKHCLLSKTDQVALDECPHQPLNLFSSQYENTLIPQNLENTSNDLSCFEKNKEIQVFTTEQNISAQSSKSEGSFNFMKETTVIPNPVLGKVNVPLTDLLKIIQTANNLPTADPVTSSNLKDAHDNDHTYLSQNSFQDNSSYDQDCLYNTEQLSRSNYCKDYQPLLKIPTVRDYGHKSAEHLDFVTLKETDNTTNKVSNDVCSSELTSTPSNESGTSNSESYNRSTSDVQDLGVSINNLEEKGSNDKKEDEQHIPQYKSRWEKIMERKYLDTSSPTKFSNHLLEDCFPVKLSKSKLTIRKPIAHVQPCGQNRTKESLKLKELPSSSNNPPPILKSIKSKKGNLDSLKFKELPSSSNNPPPTLKSIKTKIEKVKSLKSKESSSSSNNPPPTVKSTKAKKGKLPPKKDKEITKSKKKLKSPSKNKSIDNESSLFQPDKITKSKETICSDSGDAEKNSEQSSSSRVYGRITNRGSFLTQSSVNQPPKSKAVVGKKSINKMKNCLKTPDVFHLMVSSPNIEIASTSKIFSNDSKELLYKSNYKTKKSGLLVESSIGANAGSENSPKSKNPNEIVTNFSLDITLQSSNNPDLFSTPEPDLSAAVLPKIPSKEICLPTNIPFIPNPNDGKEISQIAKRPLLPTPKIGIHHHVMKNEFKLTPPIHHRYSDLNRNYSLGDLNMGISSPIQSSPSLIGSPIDLKMDSILNSPVAGQFSAVPSALNLPNRSNHHRLPRSRHSKCVCLPPRSLKASVGNAVFDTINVLLLILEWNVDWLVQQQKNHDPPPISNSVRKVINVYENIDDYYNTYFPLMLLETWQRIYMSWTHLNQASPYFCQVTSYAVETHSIKVDCQTVFKNSDADRGIFPDEGNIIMIKFGTKEKGGIKILGFVTKVKVEPFDTVTDSQNLCYRTLKFSSTENLQKLFLTFIGAYTSDGFDLNQLIRIQVLCSVKSTLKQNDALLFLKNSPLYKNILNPLTDGLRMVTVVSRCTDLLKVKDSVPECVRDIVKGILSPHPLPLLTIAKSLPSSDRLLVLPPLIEKMKHSYRTKVLLCTRTTKALTEIGFNLCTGSIKFVIMGKRTDIHQKLRKYFIDELAVKRLTKDSTENSSTNEDSKGELLENTKIDVLKNCDVILSPIRNCHNDLIAKAWVDGDTIAQMCCIIDEANLCTESEILIPLLYGMSKLILIGDPDVPAKVCSRAAANNDYNRSLFHRAYELDLASE